MPDVPARGDDAQRRQWITRRRDDLEGDPSSAGRWRRGLFRAGSTVATSHVADWEERHWTSRLLHNVGELVSHSLAGVVAATLVAVWGITGAVIGFPDWWQTVLYSCTASVTFVMVFVIQHTQSRQTSATQRKLDELVRATNGADDSLIAVEEASDEHLQALTELNLDDRQRTSATTQV